MYNNGTTKFLNSLNINCTFILYMNTIEQILLDHSIDKIKIVEPGDFVNVNLDLVILLDIAGYLIGKSFPS